MPTPEPVPTMRRRALLAHAAAGGLLPGLWAAAAQAQAPAPGAPRRGGTLVATWGGLEPQALFVAGGGGASPFLTSTKILERLLRQDVDLGFKPALALSVAPSPDFRRYTVLLRPGVRWHDGAPFTSADVVYNVEQHWKPIAAGLALKALVRAEAPDPLTVVLHFDAPVPEFFLKSTLAGEYQLVLPRHLYEGKDIVTHPLNNTPVGTGPWKYGQWVRGSHLAYIRNDQYWQPGRPYLDRLLIRWWGDPASRAAALETGELGLAFSSPVPARDINRLLGTGRVAIDTRGYENSTWAVTVEFNQRREVVKRRDVRHALLHAIDRQFIVDTIYYGRGKPAVSPVVSSNAQFFTSDVAAYPFDPAKAAALLDAAGFPDKGAGRFTVNLLAAAWFEENAKLGQYLKQAFEDVGVKVRLDSVDRATALKRIYGDYDYDIAISNYTASQELVPRLTQFFTTDGIVKGAAFRNATGYTNPEVDALVARLTVETDPAARRGLAHQFSRIVTTDVPLTPLVEIEAFTLASKKLHGYTGGANAHGEALDAAWLEP